MSFSDLLSKAKAKATSLADQHNIKLPSQFTNSHPQQNQGQYQGQYQNQYPGQHQNQYPGQIQNQHQNQYPPQNQNQWQSTGPPPPPQYPSHQNGPPPLPQHPSQYGPNSNNGPPPIPSNRPTSASPQSQPYWRPEFDVSHQVSQTFKHQLGDHGWGNNELQNYIAAPENSFYTPDGKLVLRAIASNGQFTSARLTSLNTLGKQKGSLVTVVTPPCAQGVWPALWLLPNEPFQWPNEAEIDILETWNGDGVNHTCLHWGHFNGEDWNKHRVTETRPEGLGARPVKYEFTWEQPEGRGRNEGGGRAIWSIDGKAVMKAGIPEGARRMDDWQIIINVAMGGNVCQGLRPADGHYDMVVHELSLHDEPSGGWGRFEQDWQSTPEGHP